MGLLKQHQNLSDLYELEKSEISVFIKTHSMYCSYNLSLKSHLNFKMQEESNLNYLVPISTV